MIDPDCTLQKCTLMLLRKFILLSDMGEMRQFKEVPRYSGASGVCSLEIPDFEFIHWCYSNNLVFRMAEGKFVSCIPTEHRYYASPHSCSITISGVDGALCLPDAMSLCVDLWFRGS
jgi:hypothetical protein